MSEEFDRGWREGYLRGLRDGERAALEYEDPHELPEGATTASIAFLAFLAVSLAVLVWAVAGSLK